MSGAGKPGVDASCNPAIVKLSYGISFTVGIRSSMSRDRRVLQPPDKESTASHPYLPSRQITVILLHLGNGVNDRDEKPIAGGNDRRKSQAHATPS